ncbi:MAG: hypothetical protein NUV51_03620 [Sulfuricaulis sp.]|nr:hypothetical protein [Sulfuricaulis sp.]
MAYFPNGSAGEVFENQCAQCRYGDEPCPIYLAQYEHNYAACNNEVASKILDTLIKNDGTCAMFALDPPWFDKESGPANDAERAYLELGPSVPANIRELVLKVAGRIA